MLPVISPISLGLDGHTYNVNADHAAAALACALGAVELVFISNVPGVLVSEAGSSYGSGGLLCSARNDKAGCIPALTAVEAEALIASGVIHGGMVPKVRSALAALAPQATEPGCPLAEARGVPRVRITDLDGLIDGYGTCFLSDADVI